MNNDSLPSVYFKGIKISNIDLIGVMERIDSVLVSNERGYICVNDTNNIILATKDRLMAQAVRESLISIADGTPLAWYAHSVGCRKIERISGMDLMVSFFATGNRYKHFLLGDTEQTTSRVINKAKSMNNGIQIMGHNPPFKEFDDNDNQKILEMLNMENPDIIWVSFGGGKQEKWMYSNIHKLNRGVMVGIGAAFKWYLGDIRTPPKIIQKMGMQWAFRVVPAFFRAPVKNWKKIRTGLARKIVFAAYFPWEVLRHRKSARDLLPVTRK